MTDIGAILQEELCRKYIVYWVGFVKHRRKRSTRFKNFGEACALFKHYKTVKKYKSAYMEVSPPPFAKLAEGLFAENATLKLLNKPDDFAGDAIKVPIEYKSYTARSHQK